MTIFLFCHSLRLAKYANKNNNNTLANNRLEFVLEQYINFKNLRQSLLVYSNSEHAYCIRPYTPSQNLAPHLIC